ncbi:hypothetical protein GP2143_08669 [marine gamma proteobacterium HTCC2143]|uniref:Uncharacterized protein n=1 Tax=marine gamma proteobacterium HTCC2143 TaxID=247633 RepID=A0YCU1_9GAMM|nr:hypothetical protein GP2143_08669 [marine gamma proteobacterium HTCC2143]
MLSVDRGMVALLKRAATLSAAATKNRRLILSAFILASEHLFKPF